MMYEHLLQLDSVKINFSAAGMNTINLILSFVMFGVALGIKPQMFKKVFSHPKSVIVGLVSQLFFLPAITFVIIVLLRHQLSPMVAMGMILVASCPGGNISNFMSQLSKANIELSVSLTAVTTSLAVFLTPANFALWGGLYVHHISPEAGMALRTLHINIFQMFKTVFLLLGIPLILGVLTSHYLPKIAEKLKKPFQYFSIIFFMLMVVLAFRQNFKIFIDHIGWVFFIVLLHNFLALATGFTLATIFKLPRPDRRTLTIETGIQNSGLGLVLLFNPKIFPPTLAIGGMLFITAWWGIWHIVSGLTISSIFRKSKLIQSKGV